MKFLKSLFSFTVPLIVVLVIYIMYSTMSSLVSTYKQNISQDYAIIVVTEDPINAKEIESEINFDVSALEDLKREEILLDNHQGEFYKTREAFVLKYLKNF